MFCKQHGFIEISVYEICNFMLLFHTEIVKRGLKTYELVISQNVYSGGSMIAFLEFYCEEKYD